MQSELQALFENLDSPPADTDGSLHVNTIRLSAKSAHRLGKTADGSPVLLLRVTGKPDNKPPNVRLENLSVLHDVPCRIWSTSDRVVTGKFSVVRCSSSLEDVRRYFLHIMDPLLKALGRNPTASNVSQLIDHLVEIFRALSQPQRGSVQGLWAELLLISRSQNPTLAVQSWHSAPEEVFDFTSGSARLEVKSSAGSERRHFFSLEQISHVRLGMGAIASFLVQRAGGGTSVGDLAGRVRHSVASNPELVLRVDRTIALTLGDTSSLALEERFNEAHARQSLAFFDPGQIPRPRDIPEEVSKVSFEVNISALAPIPFLQMSKAGGLLKAVVPKP